MNIASASLASGLFGWLEQNSSCLDRDNTLAAEVLPRLAAAGVLGAGVPKEHGGSGGDVTDGIRAIADISRHSLAAGFVLWGHRAYIELLLQSPNTTLRGMLLPDLIAGRVAGATGLSNAMKFLAGLEELQVNARPRAGGFALTGKLPWVTNLRPQGFHVAAAVAHEGGVFIASLAHDDPGLVRSADLDLMALRGSNTAAVSIADVQIHADRVIHPDASVSLPAGSWVPATLMTNGAVTVPPLLDRMMKLVPGSTLCRVSCWKFEESSFSVSARRSNVPYFNDLRR